MKINVLGTGTSVGIPSIGKLGWGKCNPDNPKNRRQRCAITVENNNTRVLVDAGPDIKNQLWDNNIDKIDSLLITHEHSDHVSGLDELRPFYFSSRQKIDVFTHKRTASFIKKRFDYLFTKSSNSQSYFEPPLKMNIINFYEEFEIGNINIKTIKQDHGVMNTLGFIFNNKFAYCTDVVNFPKKSFDLLYDLDVLIITGLRESPHIAHAHFDMTFKWIKELKPKFTYLTHFSPDSDHEEVLKLCPKNVEPAYDGLIITI